MNKTKLILVGGFLGAGKTSLLWESARRLTDGGKKVGLITNDQASELVDTAFLQRENDIVLEVSGSCFCCNFHGLTDAIRQAAEEKASEIILAEPVGSCTDLSATILQPLKQQFWDRLELAPFTVLADPVRLEQILAGNTAGLHESAAYIFRKQLEEADLILITKTDLLDQDSLALLTAKAQTAWPQAEVLSVSAKNGDGIDHWLNEVLSRTDAGKTLLEIDYDIYAEGEAVLGWLNSSYRLQGEETDWNQLFQNLLLAVGKRLDRDQLPVGHVKMLLESEGQTVIGNLTGDSSTLSLRGQAGSGTEARLTVNARVELQPEELKNIISDELERAFAGVTSAEELASRCLSPGRPAPTFRYEEIYTV